MTKIVKIDAKIRLFAWTYGFHPSSRPRWLDRKLIRHSDEISSQFSGYSQPDPVDALSERANRNDKEEMKSQQTAFRPLVDDVLKPSSTARLCGTHSSFRPATIREETRRRSLREPAS